VCAVLKDKQSKFQQLLTSANPYIFLGAAECVYIGLPLVCGAMDIEYVTVLFECCGYLYPNFGDKATEWFCKHFILNAQRSPASILHHIMTFLEWTSSCNNLHKLAACRIMLYLLARGFFSKDAVNLVPAEDRVHMRKQVVMDLSILLPTEAIDWSDEIKAPKDDQAKAWLAAYRVWKRLGYEHETRIPTLVFKEYEEPAVARDIQALKTLPIAFLQDLIHFHGDTEDDDESSDGLSSSTSSLKESLSDSETAVDEVNLDGMDEYAQLDLVYDQALMILQAYENDEAIAEALCDLMLVIENKMLARSIGLDNQLWLQWAELYRALVEDFPEAQQHLCDRRRNKRMEGTREMATIPADMSLKIIRQPQKVIHVDGLNARDLWIYSAKQRENRHLAMEEEADLTVYEYEEDDMTLYEESPLVKASPRRYLMDEPTKPLKSPLSPVITLFKPPNLSKSSSSSPWSLLAPVHCSMTILSVVKSTFFHLLDWMHYISYLL
jgi:hypothetical protein